MTDGTEPTPGASEPEGLWASGRARYQQPGYDAPITLASPGGGARRPQGSWRAGPYRSSAARGMVLQASIGATMIVSAVYSVLALGAFLLMATDATEIALDAMGLLLAAGSVSLLGAAGYVVTAIALMAWLSRVVDNVPSLTGWTPDRGPRAAIGWWFVPLASYVVPFQIVQETVALLEHPRPVSRGVISAWWAFFLVSIFGTLLVNSISGSAATVGNLRTVILIELVPDVALLVSGVLLIVIVRRAEHASARLAAQIAVHPILYHGGPSRAELAASHPGWDPDTRTQAPAPQPDQADLPRREHVIVSATADGPAAPPPPPS